jgi:hypothetical protein
MRTKYTAEKRRRMKRLIDGMEQKTEGKSEQKVENLNQKKRKGKNLT